MRELKADKTFVFGEECEAYKKSEADKVIEEKDKRIARLTEGLADALYTVAILRKDRSREKYKRCLAMAKWCFTKSNYHFVLARHGEDAKKNSRKSELYAKWHKRWLELADKFKEDK